MILQQVFDNFILSRKLADLSPMSITSYKNCLAPFIDYIGSSKPFAEITQADLTDYQYNIVQRPLSKSTRATYIRNLKTFLKWAQYEYGSAYDFKKIRVPRSSKRQVRIYTPDDIALIFSNVETSVDWVTLRNKTMIALMYDSGLRQAEVCDLRHQNVIYAESRLVVHGKGDKERIVPLGKITHQYLQAYLDKCPYSTNHIFVTFHGEPMTCNAVKLFVSKLADKLPFDLSSHKLRHNFATNYCIDQYEKYGKIDIYQLKAIMGHEDIATTERYLHVANEIIASRACISHLDKISLGII